MAPTNYPPRIALITGSAKRIGAAIAEYLHQHGFLVVIHAHHSVAMAQTLAEKLNRQRANSALVLTGDLTVKQSLESLIDETIHWAGQLDLLVNNASTFACTDIQMLDDSHWNKLFTTNVRAPFWLSQKAYPHLAQQKGNIINITDIHADKPLKGYAVYCQTKAALAMQTKALAREFAPNVRVNAIAPGAIAWPEHENILNEELKQKIIDRTPLKRHGDPLFIAQAVLAMNDNPFVTGQILNVDGGRSLT